MLQSLQAFTHFLVTIRFKQLFLKEQTGQSLFSADYALATLCSLEGVAFSAALQNEHIKGQQSDLVAQTVQQLV